VDNVQRLDAVSAEVLTAVARRVYAEGIAGLFAVREPAGRRLPLDALTELFLPQAARPGCPCLLALVAGGRLDDGIAARLVTETRGNLLALIELRGELTEGLRKQAGSSRPIVCLPSEAQWLANSSLRGSRGAA
jgi:hypothetical protein